MPKVRFALHRLEIPVGSRAPKLLYLIEVDLMLEAQAVKVLAVGRYVGVGVTAEQKKVFCYLFE